jgi:hypothetical protein
LPVVDGPRHLPAGTVDIHAVVDRIALRVVELSHDEQPGALDRLRSLIVFLGSEGLPCAARDDVASWEPTERLHDSIACTLGLLGIVAGVEGKTTAEAVAGITPPRRAVAPEGTFGLAWRGPERRRALRRSVCRAGTPRTSPLSARTRARCARSSLASRCCATRLSSSSSPRLQHFARRRKRGHERERVVDDCLRIVGGNTGDRVTRRSTIW